MKKVYAIAHTHWDFEWYFTRQEARVQFAYHMDEVLSALAHNQLDYYLLDGQMSILMDYLADNPDRTTEVKKFVMAGRLFIGPWYTQIDEMTTAGESAVHNLRLGLRAANKLGGAMPVGYLPDSFGQSQDIPKIYGGFGIHNAVFWRGLPLEKNHKFFHWCSQDGSDVLTANLTNGYSTGVPFVTGKSDQVVRDVLADPDSISILPVGSDQLPVTLNLKQVIKQVNTENVGKLEVKETNYPALFSAIGRATLPTLEGEFIDPSTSKIHRGIYSSRADLKQLYDHLERLMTTVVEPLSVLASQFGVRIKQGLIDSVWRSIAMGQAHDSAGGSNSDATNRDIYARGTAALETATSLRNYLLRELSISLRDGRPDDGSLVVWNPLPLADDTVHEVMIATTNPSFSLTDDQGNPVQYDLISQKRMNAGLLTRDPATRKNHWYFMSTIAVKVEIPAMDWCRYGVELSDGKPALISSVTKQAIEDGNNLVEFDQGQLLIRPKQGLGKTYQLMVEDGGDEGDTYDYSQPYRDAVKLLKFVDAQVTTQHGKLEQRMLLSGSWQVPKDLAERGTEVTSGTVDYQLELRLKSGTPIIQFSLHLNNQVCDHRMRLVLKGAKPVKSSFADTQFGTIERPLEDPHLKDWRVIGYHEEPTSMRPMIHFANMHSESESLTFLGLGEKDFQIIGKQFDELALTLFRGVGYLGRPDMLRRPGKASGMINKAMPTPDSQLLGKMNFAGGILISKKYDPQQIQSEYLRLAQEGLYYQNQTLNQYTTPIQFFRINVLSRSVTHASLMTLKNSRVTLSAFAPTPDGAGCEIRLYNPNNFHVDAPGELVFTRAVNVTDDDLAGKSQRSIADSVTSLKLAPFKPGEIRTYGVFPIADPKQA